MVFACMVSCPFRRGVRWRVPSDATAVFCRSAQVCGVSAGCGHGGDHDGEAGFRVVVQCGEGGEGGGLPVAVPPCEVGGEGVGLGDGPAVLPGAVGHRARLPHRAGEAGLVGADVGVVERGVERFGQQRLDVERVGPGGHVDDGRRVELGFDGGDECGVPDGQTGRHERGEVVEPFRVRILAVEGSHPCLERGAGDGADGFARPLFGCGPPEFLDDVPGCGGHGVFSFLRLLFFDLLRSADAYPA